MTNKGLINGLGVLTTGLLASSLSSFLADFSLLGTATEFTRGVFDGLADAEHLERLAG